MIEYINSPMDTVYCCDCDKAFNRNSEFQEHMMINSGEKPYQCSDCDKIFKSNSIFKSLFLLKALLQSLQ